MSYAKRQSKASGKNSKQYAHLSYDMLRSANWRSLNPRSIKVLFELIQRFNGFNNGSIRLSYREAADRLGMSKSTVKRAFEELGDREFVKTTRKGDFNSHLASEYFLTFLKYRDAKRGRKVEPSNDWIKHERKLELGPKNRSPVPGEPPKAR